jgi:CubicO group peptidase (beta-lactamase class C family)
MCSKKIKYIILAFMLVCCSVNMYAQYVERIEEEIEKVFNKFNLVGLQTIIILDNKIIHSSCFGFSNVELSKEVNIHTAFRIASISKTITITAIMQLYERGLLSLDDDVSKYLGFKLRNPNHPNDIITIRQLANHVSGLNDGSGYDGFLEATYSSNIPPIRELVQPNGKFFTNDMWTNSQPNSKYLYCNCAYGLLGTIVERVANERFDIYCKKNIFEPLDVKSNFNVDEIDLSNLAVLYRNLEPQYDDYGEKKEPRDLSSYIIGANGAAFSPQGGLRTSAIDLSHFLLMHINKGKWNDKQILHDTTAIIVHGKIFPYYGWERYKFQEGVSFAITQSLVRGQVLIGHAGGAYGLVSGMYFDKDRRYGIIFFANGGNYGYVGEEYSLFQTQYMALLYSFIRPKLSPENGIFVDIELLKALPKDN